MLMMEHSVFEDKGQKGMLLMKSWALKHWRKAIVLSVEDEFYDLLYSIVTGERLRWRSAWILAEKFSSWPNEKALYGQARI